MCSDVKIDMDKTSCNCLDDAQCSHPKEALEYCVCCNCIVCKNCNEKWHSLQDQYQFNYYPPVIPYDLDPPFYTTCECKIGD